MNSYDRAAWNEIEELERCYGADLREARLEMNFTNEDKRVNTNNSDMAELVGAVFANLEECAKRAGTRGPWCFFCGISAREAPSVHCECGFSESFGCGVQDRRICPACSTAHVHVAEHLRQMFAAKRVSRVSSVRARLHRNLRDAAAPDHDSDDFDAVNPKTASERLRFYLAGPDPYDDELTPFREGVLRAFRRAKVLDWQGLDRGLARAKEAELSRAALIYLSHASGQPSPVLERSSAVRNAKNLDFYK